GGEEPRKGGCANPRPSAAAGREPTDPQRPPAPGAPGIVRVKTSVRSCYPDEMQLPRHCTAVLLALITATAASAQTPAPAAPVPGEATFEVFLRGAGAGRIVVHLTRTAAGWTISSTGRVGDLVTNRFELKYSPA